MNNPLKHTYCVCKYTYKYISAGWCDDDNDYDDVGDDDDGGEIGAQVVLRQVAYSRPPAQYILKSSAPSTLPPAPSFNCCTSSNCADWEKVVRDSTYVGLAW